MDMWPVSGAEGSLDNSKKYYLLFICQRRDFVSYSKRKKALNEGQMYAFFPNRFLIHALFDIKWYVIYFFMLVGPILEQIFLSYAIKYTDLQTNKNTKYNQEIMYESSAKEDGMLP